MTAPAPATPDHVVREALLASNRGDIETFLGHLHPDITWQSTGLFIHPAHLWRGRDEVRRAVEGRPDHFGAHPHVTLTEIISRENLVFAVGSVSAPALQAASLPIAFLFELRDARIVYARGFATVGHGRAEWRRWTARDA